MDPSPLPMACSEPPSDREEAFKVLLLTTSQRLNEHDIEQLAFLTEPGGTNVSPLQLLTALRKRGRFCPLSGSRLEDLLRTVNRYDLADRVKEYVERFPDKRHRSVQERGSAPLVTPKKRSVTDPPPNVHSVLYNRESTPERPVVQQEEGMEARSVLHVTNTPSDGSLRSEGRTYYRPSTGDEYSFHSEPPSYAIATPPRDCPDESPPLSPPMYRAPGAYGHPPQRALTSEQGLPNMNPPLSLPRSTSQISQEPLGYYSTDASSESSLHSLQQPSYRQLRQTTRTALQMALDLLPGEPSQETLSDPWYRSSLSSMGSNLSGRCANCSDPTTGYASFLSDTESRPPQLRRKKYSRSYHGPPPKDPPHESVSRTRGTSFQHSSPDQRSHAEERRGHSPPTNRQVTDPALQYPLDTGIKGLTMDDIQYEYREDESTPQEEVVRRKRNDQSTSARSAKNFPDLRSHSSDHTPPVTGEGMATLRQLKGGMSELEQSRTPRASMYSETTSEGTVVSPRTSFYGRESVQDSDDHMSSGQQSPQPTKFKKEKSLWRRLSFFKSKSRHSPDHFFTWRVVREDLMKPVWRHEQSRCITRPHKFELDAGLGKHNPKLSFNLYPYGQFKDFGKCVTMAVRISTSDKCPPLPPTSQVHISLVVWDGEREGAEVNHCRFSETLNMSVFYIHGLITHNQLKESHSKHFHLDVEVSCTGVAHAV